jgi:hypothetical protein
MILIVQYHSHNPDFIDSTHRVILFWKEFERKSISVLETFHVILLSEFIFHMNYVIEGQGDKPFKMICGVPKEFE